MFIMVFIDKNGKEIKFKDALNVPLDIFSNGIVIKNENDELSLELRYESKKVPLSGLDSNFFNFIEVLNY
jgi:hypothetical protein